MDTRNYAMKTESPLIDYVYKEKEINFRSQSNHQVGEYAWSKRISNPIFFKDAVGLNIPGSRVKTKV